MAVRSAKPLPPQDYLRECFYYEPETGVLIWRRRPLRHFKSEHRCNNANSRFAGRVAGSVMPRGYLIVSIDYEKYLVHRIIWKLVTGEDPPEHIDHKDTDPSNNRWRNLRDATHQQNSFNRPLSRVNRSGHKGVCWDASRQRFAAYIQADGRSKFLGRFDTREEASIAYRAAASVVHGEFAHTLTKDQS